MMPLGAILVFAGATAIILTFFLIVRAFATGRWSITPKREEHEPPAANPEGGESHAENPPPPDQASR